MLTQTTIGERIGEAMRARKMTADDLAFAVRTYSNGHVRCTARSVTNWTKHGTEPRASVLPLIARALHVSVEWLISGDDADRVDGDEDGGEPG